MAKRPTDEEAWIKKWAENPPELLEGTGPLTRNREPLSLLDNVSDMVREKMMILTTD
ncbi:MAG: hypothetical protein FWG77_06430 [Treponema sp.]|nr:hypothetical protein [Treponema sp.]